MIIKCKVEHGKSNSKNCEGNLENLNEKKRLEKLNQMYKLDYSSWESIASTFVYENQND